MAQQSSNELQSQTEKLQSQMEKLVKDFDEMVERNGLPHRAELADIFSILGKSIKDKQIISQLPEDKKGELLDNLLPQIDRMLQQCKSAQAKPKQQQQPAKTKKKMPSVSDCNPFKSRSSSPSPDQGQGKQQGDDDQDAAAPSVEEVKAVKQKIVAILGDPKEVEYYEWTTSYVDETRIYGWDNEADMVVDALVGPRPPADQADKKDDAPAAEANNKDTSKVEKTEAPAEGEELLFRAAGIAGIHGSGKTALAQKVFVHDRIKDAFPLRLWVCVGPPDYEDRFNLLYRMLDNLGLDTEKVEKIVEDSEAVKKSKEAVKKSKDSEAAKKFKDSEAVKKSKESEAVKNSKESEAVKNSKDPEAVKNSEDPEAVNNFKDSEAVNNSRIGVLLFILHVTLYKTGYLIVFDDIRASYRQGGGKDGGKDGGKGGGKDGGKGGDKDSGRDGWYSNLTLPPPKEGEWFDRLAYGLPKAKKSAVLVTCRNEDHARIMVRTGSVFRPPKLGVKEGWQLFEREYEEAKKQIGGGSSDFKLEEDKLYKDLEKVQKEIVDKCLGLPVAIIEAAKGFAKLEPLRDETDDPPAEAKPAEESKSEPAAAQAEAHEDGQSA